MNHKNSICIILTDAFKTGGVQRVTTTVFNQLAEEYDITLLSIFCSSSKLPFSVVDSIKVEKLFEAPSLQFNVYKSFFIIRKKMKEYFELKDFDFYLVDGLGLTGFAYPAIRKKKGIKIGWEHQCYFFGKVFGIEWYGKRLCMKRFNTIVTLTKKDFALFTSKKPKSKIVQIYNPMTTPTHGGLYNPKFKRIISVGSLTKQKGFDYAIEIGKEFFANHQDWIWDIYGEGPERGLLQQIISDNHLENNIFLRGNAEEIDKLYPQYSVFCLTSRHEGFPMVLLEAVAHKLPIIAFDCFCGPSEIVVPERTGYLVDPFNISSFSHKLEALAESEILRQTFSNAIVQNEDFSLNSVVEKWRKVLREG